MKNNTKSKAPRTSQERSRRVFVIFSAAFLSVVLTVGLIFGVIGIARSTSSVMSYKGIYLSEGVSNYLTASYKYDFMSSLKRSGVDCYDSHYFWESEASDGKTWGDVLKENTESYLKRVLVGSYLFDRNTRLNSNDKSVIDKAISEVVEYRADGSIQRFNEIGEKMGFGYRDFVKAAELMYKYEMAQTVIFGYDGSALESGYFSAECDEYFEDNYAHVKLLIIRTDGELVTDSETGKEVISEYDEATRAKVLADIERIRKLIGNHNNDVGDEQMSEAAFDMYIDKYKTGTVNDTEGYYFSQESSYSLEFAEDAPEVVRLSLATDIGYYDECELEFGVCFIYRCPLEDNAYTRIGIAHFFGDFYAKAASYVYTKSLDAYLDAVTVKNRYDRGAVVDKPYNHDLALKFG